MLPAPLSHITDIISMIDSCQGYMTFMWSVSRLSEYCDFSPELGRFARGLR